MTIKNDHVCASRAASKLSKVVFILHYAKVVCNKQSVSVCAGDEMGWDGMVTAMAAHASQMSPSMPDSRDTVAAVRTETVRMVSPPTCVNADIMFKFFFVVVPVADAPSGDSSSR